MINRTLQTVLGVCLAVALMLGGWVGTRWLMDREAERLLGQTQTLSVYIPTLGAVGNWVEHGNLGRLALSEREVVSVLRSWALSDTQRFHEPVGAQLNMEQAIEAAGRALDFLTHHDLLTPKGEVLQEVQAPLHPTVLMFEPTGATLSQNITPGDAFLPEQYSYWTVGFHNSHVRVSVTVHALTGQVWGIEVAIIEPLEPHARAEVVIDMASLSVILEDFLAQLGIVPVRGGEGGSFVTITEHLPSERTAGDALYLVSDAPTLAEVSLAVEVPRFSEAMERFHDFAFENAILSQLSFAEGSAFATFAVASGSIHGHLLHTGAFNIHLTANLFGADNYLWLAPMPTPVPALPTITGTVTP